MIKFFDEVSAHDVGTCGGKGASLGEMTQAGLQVPNGFVLTTDAYKSDVSLWSTQAYAAFDTLGCELVAVRSSGTKEDGNIDSFAGQFETYLFVNKEQLIEKILACHHSLQSERIQSYCISKNINPHEINVAVVVQKMVNSDAAGVCFTVNPVTHNTEEIMIEAGYGIGEAVVSGIITPDNYTINKQSNNIQKSIAHQEKKLILDTEHGGLLEDAVETTLQHIQKVSDTHILELARLAQRIEQHYGQAMDIEWAIENSNIYILQARPITTLGEVYQQDTDPSHSIEWLMPGKFELIASRPMTFQRDEMIATCYAEYANIDRLSVNIENNNRSFYSSTEQVNTQYQKIFEEIFLDTTGRDKHLVGYTQLEHDIQKLFISYETLQNYSNQDLIHYFQKWQTTLRQFGPYVVAPFVVERIVDPFVRDLLINAYGETVGGEYFGIASSPTQYIQYQLMRKAICATKLHNTHTIQDLINNYYRYSEYVFTEQLLDTVYFEQEIANISIEDAQQEYDEITHTIEENISKYKHMITTIHNSELLHWLDVINNYVFLRTDRVDLLKQVQVRIRGFYKVVAHKIKRSYDDVLCMSNNEIINFLAHNTIPPSRITTERQPKNYVIYYHQNNQTIFTETKTVSRIVTTIEKSVHHDASIQGLSAYPGIVQGRAKKIYSREDIQKIHPGDILIARHTMVDYTPAMKIAAAFVTDEGGITSHAAIVARELKKPCVLGCKIAMKQLEDGDIIEVDADTGVVRIIKSLKDDMAYFQSTQLSYEGGRACYRIMNYGLNASYILDNFFVEIPKDFALISYATPENTQRYRSVGTDETNDQYLTQQLTGNNIIEACQTCIDTLVQEGEKLFSSHNNRDKYSKAQIHNLYQEYITLYKHMGANALVLRLMDRGIIRAIQKMYPDASDTILSLISIPLTLTHGQEEERAIVRIAEYMIYHNTMNPEAIQQKIQKELIEKFARSSLGYYNESEKDIYTYNKILSGDLEGLCKQYYQKNEAHHHVLEERKQLLMRAPQELQQIAHIAQQAARLKDHYKFCINHLQYLAESLWQEITKRTELDIDMCKHLMPEEMQIALAEGSIDQGKILDRIKTCIMYTRNGTLTVLGGEQAAYFYTSIIEPLQTIGGSERSGRIACRGKVTSKVKIVLSTDDFRKIEEGDILVVTNTSPDFVVLFDRIQGIISEEGGITAHVSVVSREYNIPCIVGVHHITKILQDNDNIELDAYTGTIRKI